MTVTPVFIFSAPRSGSTLLQRVLAAHANIETTSEPWVLLPFLTPLSLPAQSRGGRDRIVAEAVDDFIHTLPGGRSDYLAAVRGAAQHLYDLAAGPGALWFVDKTPMYHVVIDEIVEMFPQARFIFLWRNPLSVVASAVELFDEGRWEVNRYTMALFQSIDDLVDASRRHASISHTVRYEELVRGDVAWTKLMDYVGAPLDPGALERFSTVQLHGRKGDPTGTKAYSRLSQESVERWRSTIDGVVRTAWTRRYVRWIGRERLAWMGYDIDELLGQLEGGSRLSLGDIEDAGRLAGSLARDCIKRVIPPHTGGRSAWPGLARPPGESR